MKEKREEKKREGREEKKKEKEKENKGGGEKGMEEWRKKLMKERIEGGKWEREGFLLKKWEGIGDRKEEKLKGEKNWRIEEGKKIICGKNGEMNDWLSNWLINLIKYDWWLIKTKFFFIIIWKICWWWYYRQIDDREEKESIDEKKKKKSFGRKIDKYREEEEESWRKKRRWLKKWRKKWWFDEFVIDCLKKLMVDGKLMKEKFLWKRGEGDDGWWKMVCGREKRN